MDIDEILLTCEDIMDKSVEYLKNELRGVRTGRASTALVEFIKVDYYGSPTDLRSLALISIPEPTQILIKPFDASSQQAVVKAIQTSGLGLNPISEAKQIRLKLPALSSERRQQLMGSVKQMGEKAKIAVRNARRDANKHLDAMKKDKGAGVSEDQIEKAEKDTQDLLKRHEGLVDQYIGAKDKEIQET